MTAITAMATVMVMNMQVMMMMLVLMRLLQVLMTVTAGRGDASDVEEDGVRHAGPDDAD